MLVTGPANAGDQPARRAYVRVAFALMEGMAFRMKETALKVGGPALSDGERARLQQREYALNDRGGVDTRKARLNAPKNFRFTFAMLVKAGGSAWAPTYDGDGWRAMRAIDVRHQLTHPKVLADLHVGDEQLASATRAVTWFTSSMLKIMIGIAQAQADHSNLSPSGRAHRSVTRSPPTLAAS